jgi:hypothetical protein
MVEIGGKGVKVRITFDTIRGNNSFLIQTGGGNDTYNTHFGDGQGYSFTSEARSIRYLL